MRPFGNVPVGGLDFVVVGLVGEDEGKHALLLQVGLVNSKIMYNRITKYKIKRNNAVQTKKLYSTTNNESGDRGPGHGVTHSSTDKFSP